MRQGYVLRADLWDTNQGNREKESEKEEIPDADSGRVSFIVTRQICAGATYT